MENELIIKYSIIIDEIQTENYYYVNTFRLMVEYIHKKNGFSVTSHNDETFFLLDDKNFHQIYIQHNQIEISENLFFILKKNSVSIKSEILAQVIFFIIFDKLIFC